MAPIAELWDDFNDGVIDPAKWAVVAGTITESGGTLCMDVPTSAALYGNLAESWELTESSAFVEVVSYLNGAGATAGQSLFRLYNTADTTDFLQILVNAQTGDITFQHVENGASAASSTVAYDPVAMRWWRIRETGGTVFFETSPNGVTWTTQFSTASPAWIGSVRPILSASQTGGDPTTKCWDNFNLAPASARTVPVGTEFEISVDGELGLNRCDKPDDTWPYACDQAAFNAIRRSENPCGLWVQPPAQQYTDSQNEVRSGVGSSDEITIFTLDLVNPDPCRSMLFYLPLTAGMKIEVTASEEDTGIFSWTLGVQVEGVDNPDTGFTPVAANDFGAFSGVHLWRGEADYYWTAPPGGETTVTVKLKAFSGGGSASLLGFEARFAQIGWSEVV